MSDTVNTTMMLFEIEAWWGDEQTTIVRYIEAPDIKAALEVVPEETAVVSIKLLGGLYKPAQRPAEGAKS